ncbi:MAG: Rid family hydrolase [Nitrospirota bacterium]|nr:Rid family hydrolase [Nitrospirota bacterium]
MLSLYDQSREALSTIDRNLQEAGTDKSRILMVMAIYHGHRQEARVQPRMGEWVDRANLPLRACVGASLEHDDLIELVVTAARGPECGR